MSQHVIATFSDLTKVPSMELLGLAEGMPEITSIVKARHFSNCGYDSVELSLVDSTLSGIYDSFAEYVWTHLDEPNLVTQIKGELRQLFETFRSKDHTVIEYAILSLIDFASRKNEREPLEIGLFWFFIQQYVLSDDSVFSSTNIDKYDYYTGAGLLCAFFMNMTSRSCGLRFVERTRMSTFFAMGYIAGAALDAGRIEILAHLNRKLVRKVVRDRTIEGMENWDFFLEDPYMDAKPYRSRKSVQKRSVDEVSYPEDNPAVRRKHLKPIVFEAPPNDDVEDPKGIGARLGAFVVENWSRIGTLFNDYWESVGRVTNFTYYRTCLITFQNAESAGRYIALCNMRIAATGQGSEKKRAFVEFFNRHQVLIAKFLKGGEKAFIFVKSITDTHIGDKIDESRTVSGIKALNRFFIVCKKTQEALYDKTDTNIDFTTPPEHVNDLSASFF